MPEDSKKEIAEVNFMAGLIVGITITSLVVVNQ